MKKKITILLGILSGITALLFIALNFYIQVQTVQNDMEFMSNILFAQIENVISQNEISIQQTKEEHSVDCLARAHAAAYILQQNKDEIDNVSEMKKICDLLQVDEIHVFDKDGAIYAGSIPEYYGYTMDSGEQMHFFTPMLSDTSLELCQEITPNTAEGKLMQYAAVWLEDHSAIIQIGMKPERILKQMENNELSFIFSLFTVEKGSALFAVDPETYEIIGASKEYMLGRDIREYGIAVNDMVNESGVHRYNIKGNQVCCVFNQTDTVIIGRIVSEQKMYSSVKRGTISLLGGMLIVSLIVVCFTAFYLNKIVIHPIKIINMKLSKIARGDFTIKIEETSSPEFADLSSRINDMVKCTLEITDTISNFTEAANLAIGIYECHNNMDHVRITNRVPEILHLDEKEMECLFNNPEWFKRRIQQLCQKPFDKENHIFILDKDGQEFYIKVERAERSESVFGIISDCTEEILEKRFLQEKLGQDTLTGLDNRRKLEEQLDWLFKDPVLKYGAVIVVDADDLKKVNDTYGHENGDCYLCGLADLLTSLQAPNQITARIGGDEFVIYFGGMHTPEEVEACLDRLYKLRDKSFAQMTDGTEVPIRYSLGAVFFPAEGNDWHELFKLADERMYADKRQRKGTAAR